jgi:anthranilate synthase component 1
MPGKSSTPRGTSIAATALCRTLPSSACASPDRVCERLQADGRTDLMLFQTGDGDAVGAARWSVLVASSLLRLQIRQHRVEVRALTAAALPLLPSLAQRLDGARVDGDRLTANLPTATAGGDDGDVLRSPCVLDALRAAAGLLADSDRQAWLAPGLFGALGYELVDQFEAIGPRRRDPLDEPDALLVLAADVIVFDLVQQRVQLIVRGLPWERAADVADRRDRLLAMLRTAAAPPPAFAAIAAPPARGSDPDFLAAVAAVQEHVRAGEVFQTVLSRQIAVASAAPPLQVYRALAALNPSPWQFYLDLGDGELLGASPEACIAVAHGCVELRPIAGTAPRGLDRDGGIDQDLDARLALQLLLDPKEQAEHAMLVDLARNDLARVTRPGSTRVVELMALQRLGRVQHLTSRVRGELRPGFDALHAYRAAANMGTLTGAPKPRAMELIRALEGTARGFYGGAVGWLLADGTMATCIAIRCLRRKGGVYHLRAGAGVVLDSVPERELQETEHKLASGRQALAACTPGGGR